MSPAFVPGALSKAFAVRVGADCSVRVAVVSGPGRCGYWTRHRKLHAITVIDLDPDADPPKVLAIGADSAGNFLRGHLARTRQHGRGRDSRDGRHMTSTHGTKTGRILTDVEVLKTRRRGRPAMGSGPADVVPVRIDPELRAAIDARAQSEDTTTSVVIREAIRKFLEVA